MKIFILLVVLGLTIGNPVEEMDEEVGQRIFHERTLYLESQM